MGESLPSRLKRLAFNFYPVYRRTGARIVYFDDTRQHIRIGLPLNPVTRNYIGTISGIRMYGATDPLYMVMLIEPPGRDSVVRDKEAGIRIQKARPKNPGRRLPLFDETIPNQKA